MIKNKKWIIYFSNENSRFAVNKRKVIALTCAILRYLDRKLPARRRRNKNTYTLSFLLTTDSLIKKLNARYRKKNKATDVLSFSLHEGESGPVVASSLGDLVISLDTTKRQSIEYNCSLEQEFLRLLIHGILHLHGFDHEKVSNYQVRLMQSWERKLMQHFYNKELAAVIRLEHKSDKQYSK